MDENHVVRLISQFLHERKYDNALRELEKESGRIFNPGHCTKSGELQEILDDHALRTRQIEELSTSVEHLFSPGKKEYVDEMWCSLDALSDSTNLLIVSLNSSGVLIFGGAKSRVGTLELPLPFLYESPPTPSIPSVCTVGKAAVICIDTHPLKKNLVLCGSMDKKAYLINMTDLDKPEILQSFFNHAKYVVQALWAPSGQFFVTGSYDRSICLYKLCEDAEQEYEFVEKLEMKGAVEGAAFAKSGDELVVGVRNDYLVHCFNISSGKLVETRVINLNKLQDMFVSYVPMYISFSPDGKYFLVSSDKNRLILFSWESGKQIANYYGATNDELSQPRHCWDPSGNYIYGTSQDYSVCVWEIRSQQLVTRLKGHTSTVRNLGFCKELEVLVSCSFDGTIKLWKKRPCCNGD